MNAGKSVTWTFVLGLALMGALWARGYLSPPESTGMVKHVVSRSKDSQIFHAATCFDPVLADDNAAIRSQPESEDTNATPRANKCPEDLQAWADGIGLADMPAALRHLQDQEPGDDGVDLTVQILRKWADSDVLAAARWVEQMPEGEARHHALNAVAIIWANQELAEAIGWVSQMVDGSERQDAVKSVAYEAARSDPEVALRLAVELPVEVGRDELIQYVVLQWAANDPEGAAAWGKQIGAETLREQTLAGIATVWAETDPTAAATLAVASMVPGRTQDDAVMGIVQRFVQKDPEMTAVWVDKFPDGNLKQTAVENVVKLWADSDVQQLGEWLNLLPVGPARDTAVSAFAGWLMPSAPAIAAQWARSIGRGGE